MISLTATPASGSPLARAGTLQLDLLYGEGATSAVDLFITATHGGRMEVALLAGTFPAPYDDSTNEAIIEDGVEVGRRLTVVRSGVWLSNAVVRVAAENNLGEQLDVALSYSLPSEASGVRAALERLVMGWLTATLPAGATVILANQDAPHPNAPWATVAVGGPLPLDPIRPTLAAADVVAGGAPGADLELLWVHQEERVVSVNVYSSKPTGSDTAVDLLDAAVQRLTTDAVLAPFMAAEVAVVDVGPVQDLREVAPPEHRGRAQVDLRLRVGGAVTERTTWIETVEDPEGTFS